jgi:hypothetical protein
MSGGNTKRQLMILQDFGPTAICCTPSYALNLAEQSTAMGIDMKSLKLRVGIFGAEPWSEKMRDEIENKLNLTALNIYGLSEIMGPGSLYCGGDPSGNRRVIALRRRRGAGLHDYHKGSIPPRPVSHQGHITTDCRTLPLRQKSYQNGPGDRQK